MGLSIRAYARQRGVSHVAVLRAVKQGGIVLEPDGTVDPAKADASWERSTDPGRRRSGAKPDADDLRPVPEAAVGSVRETLKEQGLPATGSLTFVQARTAREIAMAHLTRLRVQRMRRCGATLSNRFAARSHQTTKRPREMRCNASVAGVLRRQPERRSRRVFPSSYMS